MSKRKGLSAEEKRSRMLQLFYEKKDFFQLKELEKIAPKEKGIIVQSVKDVVQALVDDGLVDTEKIGTSLYFWAFPSKAKHTRKRKLDQLEEKLRDANNRLKRSRDSLLEVKIGREETSQRGDIIIKNAELKEQTKLLLSDIEKYKDSDPELLDHLKEEIQILKQATNRWTDNIFAIQSWCKNKFMIENSVLQKQFGIQSDLDYVD